MAKEIVMPRLSDSMEEGVLRKWRVRPGDRIKKGDFLADIETEKAVMEMESFTDGVMLKLVAKEGDTIPVGQTIALVGTQEEAQRGGLERKKEEAPPSQAKSEPTPQGAGEPEQEHRKEEKEKGKEEEPAPQRQRSDEPKGWEREDGAGLRSSPAARRLAREVGLDLGALEGTGPGGRITEQDVREGQKGQKAEVHPPRREGERPKAEEFKARGEALHREAPAWREGEKREGQPIMGAGFHKASPMRMAIARRVSQSNAQVPSYHVTVCVLMDGALNMATDLREETDVRISPTHLVMRAATIALREHPILNSSWDAEKNGIRIHEMANMALLVEVEGGLLMPVIKGCQNLALLDLARETDRLILRVREGDRAASLFDEGTFGISSMGMFGVEQFTPVIYPPHASMLAISSIMPGPAIRDGHLEVARKMNLTLVCDHRCVDGAPAARYLHQIKRYLERPSLLLGIV